MEIAVWNSYAMLAHQRGEHTEAVDSGLAAQSTAITKRDPSSPPWTTPARPSAT
ncbi:hypothetical protein SSP24_60330 [Streptomyces spinoverrucosus]|uniref:Uncharacterized protein n=1 Tax=Streptomyces spinoverrucosus TaxID=284043 RepID=A0A4Y3VQ94_9ACTN|nr:hypothetical protein SSP24_60330 [Streptomyces spinoverrucosus]GHB95036.1 hypothetical protein GCM10010397_79810 [Streptomyces spinoverrucosus]